MLPRADTIAAIATPAGSGGVGILRLSGPEALAVLGTLVRVSPEDLVGRRLDYGRVWWRDEAIDEVLYVAMPGPRSFTGEDVGEIHGHGGATNMARLLRCAIEAGARAADAGEFTRRAFENGRIDLTRAEAIADIVNASSERSLRLAQRQLRGNLGEAVQKLRREAVELLAEVEAHIDFPEDGLEASAMSAQRERGRELSRACAELAASFRAGRALARGISIALTGATNAGKSSLFNVLAEQERALVDAGAGTTRDFVEAVVHWEGVEVTLVDTAGCRSPESTVEERGIRLGQQRAASADLELVIVPVDQTPPQDLTERQILVRSKADLGTGTGLCTSSLTNSGIRALKEAVLERLLGAEREAEDGPVVTSERQDARLQEARASFQRFCELLGSAPLEVLAIELRQGAESLAEILGESVGEDMLDALFSRFCIGK